MISDPTSGKTKKSSTRRDMVLTRVMTMHGIIMMAIITKMVDVWNKRLMNLKTGLEVEGPQEDTIGQEDQDPWSHNHLIPKAVMTNTTRNPVVAIMINRPT